MRWFSWFGNEQQAAHRREQLRRQARAARIHLEAGEEVWLRTVELARGRLFGGTMGTTFLTNRRLVWTPRDYGALRIFLPKRIEVRRERVRAVARPRFPSWSMLYLGIPLLPLNIHLANGRYVTFLALGRERWMERLGRWKDGLPPDIT